MQKPSPIYITIFENTEAGLNPDYIVPKGYNFIPTGIGRNDFADTFPGHKDYILYNGKQIFDTSETLTQSIISVPIGIVAQSGTEIIVADNDTSIENTQLIGFLLKE